VPLESTGARFPSLGADAAGDQPGGVLTAEPRAI